MRDPLGTIIVRRTKIHRNLYNALPSDHFLYAAAARRMVELGQLVPFDFVNETEVVSPRIPFVTYPHEWCNAQFLDAAELTLTLSEVALESGHELKDASAWNVIFDGCKPLFCDHLSFQLIEDQRWWAFAQYIRHFILPLCLSMHRRLYARESFAFSRDGMNPELARNLMGWKRFATRYWLLMMGSSSAPMSGNVSARRSGPTNHKNLYAMTRWLLSGVRNLRQSKSVWLNYTAQRNHYTPDAAAVKFKAVESWLRALSPPWVIDLGCNTGEFSKLAASAGARVVALDMDHESIQDLYRSNQGEPIYPVIVNFDDLSGGRGWAGAEFPGLIDRLTQHADLLMMLAVVHHLAISSAVPYDEIAAIAARLTARYLIVELLDSDDPLVGQLASQRKRSREEFSIAVQRQAFERHFVTLEVVVIPATARQLFLMEKR